MDTTAAPGLTMAVCLLVVVVAGPDRGSDFPGDAYSPFTMAGLSMM